MGDLLPLSPGSSIPADARLISSVGLLVNEAPLTGESTPQPKDARATVGGETPLAERVTAVFAGTTVIDGEGMALVAAIGSQTELGHVAELAAGAHEQRTPLQAEMDDLTRTLAYVAIGVSLIIPGIGWLRGQDLQEMVLTWLSLTFLMVPGQPPIIITMALALAAFELARRGVIVRRLAGAETLGSVDTLLSDKTGTMTANEMVLERILLGDGTSAALDDAVAPGGERMTDPDVVLSFMRQALPALPTHSHDPTDLAVVQAAANLGLDSSSGRFGELVDEIGFSRSGTYRGMVYMHDGERQRYVAGRPEFVIERATQWRKRDEVADWASGQKHALRAQLEALGEQGKRITAYGQDDAGTPDAEPRDLVLTGCAVIEDPVRPGVKAAVGRLQAAGVRVVMVTGDIPATARYVAEQVGLGAAGLRTGDDLTDLGDPDSGGWQETASSVDVFARTTPEQKLRLVEALQREGHIVAVTGDGVNDAPALRAAHLGVAMGVRGTDVARDAADLILTDDDLAHLPEGVGIGRKAYDNFRKGITYYLSAKAILLTIFIVPLAAGVAFPFAPIQIIATELLMDLASSTIFITEGQEPDIMARRPRRRTSFLSWSVGRRILRNSIGLVVAILGVYFGSLSLGTSIDSARTAAWATWLLGHIVLALNLKQERVPLLKQGLFSNRFAAGWLAGMVILVLAMTFIPAVGSVLGTTSLSAVQWAAVVILAVLASAWIEVRKWIAFR